jgi:glutaminyl-tRNA synthetase
VAHALPAEVHLYDRLFLKIDPESVDDESQDFLSNINPNSLEVISSGYVEPSLSDAKPGERFQFERQGYFCVDKDSLLRERLVFNRTVSLKDTWAKIEKNLK